MGQIFLKDKDGLTQGFTIKGDKPSETEQARISAILNKTPAPTAPTPPEEPGIMGAFASGVGAGWNQTQAGAEGLLGLLSSNIDTSMPEGQFAQGVLGTKDYWEALRQEDKKEGEQYYMPQGTLGEQEGLYGKTRFLAAQLGQSAPATVGGIIGAAAATMLAPAGVVGGFLAGAAGAGAASVPQNYEQNIEEQENVPGHVVNPNKALIGALGQSALEGIADRATLGAAGLIGKAVPNATKSLIRNATKGAFAEAGKKVGEATLMGMSTEGVTEALQQAIQRWQADKPLGNEEAQQEYLQNAIVGSLLGGVTGGAFGTVGATLDLKERAKTNRIRKDLDETDQVGDFREGNQKAREAQAAGQLAMEDQALPTNALLEDLRVDQDLLPGPKTVMRPTAVDTGATAPVDGKASKQSTPAFTEQEYSDAVVAMRNEKLVAPDKIKNTMKIGRDKAKAIFDAMLKRTDARTAGLEGKYLQVVDGVTTDHPVETKPGAKIKRSYEVRPIPKEDQKPFTVIRQGGREVGKGFKTAEEAYSFADTHQLGDFAVVQNDTPAAHGVYEITSGVPGQKPQARLLRSHATDADARADANSLNPNISPESNEISAKQEQDARIKERAAQMLGNYQANAQAITDQLLGPGRAVIDLVDFINAPDGHPDSIIEGMTDGNLVNGVRRITLAADIFDPSQSIEQRQKAINSVAHHEVVHAAKAAGLFTPAEWRNLVNRANTRVAGKDYTYLERAQVRNEGAPRGAGLDEEAVAEMVRDYMRDPSAFENAPRSLLRKLVDFIRTLGQYSRDVANGNQVLRDFAEGKMGEREGDVTREDLYGPYYSSVKIPGFYMKSADYFEKLGEKNPNLAYPGQQWLGMLNPSKSGVKEEELQWLGLKDWLKDQKKVSIQQILQYIGANSVDVKEGILTGNGTVHYQTKQKGGEDYSELIFHMPHLQPKFAVDAHYDGLPNIIATGRFNTRIVGDKKTLFIEELQSDLHQQGRSKGYTSQSDYNKQQDLLAKKKALKAELLKVLEPAAGRDFTSEESAAANKIYVQLKDIDDTLDALDKINTIPEAPFKTTWSDFVIKRLIRHAAETGHEAIAWNAEPDGVALTEQYNRDSREFPQKMEESIGADGNPEYNVVVRDGYDNTPIDGQNVTGIVNFYTKRLAKDISKLFGKAEFGNPTIRVVPKVEGSGADLNLEELFPDQMDFDMAMDQMAQSVGSTKEARTYQKAAQVARNQRTFDPMAALQKAGVQMETFVAAYNEAFPDYKIHTGDPAIDEHGNANVARWQMDITPELKETALGKGFPMFSAVQQRTAPDTPEFRTWFGGSKVVGDDGKPITVYHGTLRDFDRFQKGFGRGYYGAGFYFSDNPDDASDYASETNGDFMSKVYEELDAQLDDDQVANEYYQRESELTRKIIESMKDHNGSVIPAYLAIKNPLYFGGNKETKFGQTERKNFLRALASIENDFLNVDAERLAQDFQRNYDDDEVLGADDFRRAVLHSAGLMDALDTDGNEVGPEVMRQAFQQMGFDGIIDDQVSRRFRSLGLRPNTTHYIAFEPNQVKSVNNTGTYNPRDNRFMYSSTRTSYSANAPMGQRNPQAVPLDRIAEIESRTTYNNIAPVLAKLFYPLTKTGLISKERATKIGDGTVFALQDVMQPLAKLEDRLRANGGSISNETDPYLNQQLMTGKIEDQINRSKKGFYDPIVNAVQKLNVTQADVNDLLARHPSNRVTVNGVPYEKAAVRNILDNHKGHPKLALAEVYLYAQHAKERNALMRERNARLANVRPDQFDSGSGMSDVEADDVLRWFGSKPFAREFSDLSNPQSIRTLYRKLISHTNDVRVEGGLNPDFRIMRDANGDPVDKYQDYAPLRGWTDNNPDHQDDVSKMIARTGKRLNISGKEDKSALGRASEGANLIANAVLQNEEAIIRANKNKVGQNFLNMLNKNLGVSLSNGPNQAPSRLSDFAEIVPLTVPKPTYDRKSGVVRMANTSVKNDPDMMIVKLGGTEVGIKIKDPRIRQAMLGNTLLGNQGQAALINGLLKVNRVLAAVRTSYNPEFLISNFFRDFGAAQLNLSELQLQGLRTDVLKSVLPAINGVYKGLREKTPNAWTAEFEDFAKHGGKTAFYGTRDLDTTIKRVMDDLSTDPEGNWEKIKGKMGSVGRLIEAQNDAVENGVRVATYKHVKEKLLQMSTRPNDPQEIERIKNRAAFIAKNLTVNFNMGGSSKPMLNALYLFFNASIQGSSALVNPLIRSKTVRRLWLSAVAAGALQDILMSAISQIAPDGEKEYDKISEDVLENNMIFINPLSEKGYFKIPMPYLFNAAWNSGRAMMRGMRGGYTVGETMNSVIGTAANSLNPWGSSGSFLNYIAPTVVDPIVDLYTNKNFAGAPIAPEKDKYSSVDLPAQRYWNNTSGFYTTLANVLDKSTGGDGVFKGAISYSPNQYEYGFEFLGGGAWSTIVRAWGMVSPTGNTAKLLKGEEVSANDVPFVRRFVGNLTGRDDLTAYLANRDRVFAVKDALKDAMKEGDSERYQQIMQAYPDEYKLSARISGYENRRRKIGAQIKKITGNTKLSDEDKKKLIEPLKKQMKDVVDQANLFMNEQ